jgi:hypothetical protein
MDKKLLSREELLQAERLRQFQLDDEDPVVWDWLRLYEPLQQYYQTQPLPFPLRDLLGDWLHQECPPQYTAAPVVYLKQMAERMHQQSRLVPVLYQCHKEIEGWSRQMMLHPEQTLSTLQQQFLYERQLWKQADFFGYSQKRQLLSDGQPSQHHLLRAEGIPLLHRVGKHEELLLRYSIQRPPPQPRAVPCSPHTKS